MTHRVHLTVGRPGSTRIDRRLFGGFVEHLGRSVYDGIYEPGHPTADADGFRDDVKDLVRELGVTAVRYPGGNFVSGHRWEDGVGPRDKRPRRPELAWHSIETNEVGLDEFARWADDVDSELLYAVNLGTRGVLEALDVLDYSNIQQGTALSDMRRENGTLDPHDIRLWYLGNEMDGPWQVGHRPARAYAQLATETARAMRMIDPHLELVVCGTSSMQVSTFGTWDREVLEIAYDEVDYISLHAYFEPKDGDYEEFLASAVQMDHFIETVVATADHVGAVHGSSKKMMVSFDEWNVWYASRYHDVERITAADQWPYAPRLLEDVYSVVDAVVVGNLLISLLRHSDRVRAACIAQLVNVIAPIMTEPGGASWRQTIFHPFALTSRFARGASLPVAIDAPTYTAGAHGEVASLDAAATFDPETGEFAVFIVNRDMTSPAELSLDVSALGNATITEILTVADDDIHAINTAADPERVSPRALNADVENARIEATLAPVSWTVIAGVIR